MSKTYYVYILASGRNGTLYIGVTNDLIRRVWEHREGLVPGFTKEYGVKLLVYFETFDDIHAAIARETRLKKYKREWKMNLIQTTSNGVICTRPWASERVNWVARVRGP